MTGARKKSHLRESEKDSADCYTEIKTMFYTDSLIIIQYIQLCLEMKMCSMITKLSIMSIFWKAMVAMKSHLLAHLTCCLTVVASSYFELCCCIVIME